MPQLADFEAGTRGIGEQLKSAKIIDAIVIDAAAKLVIARALTADEQYALWFADVLHLELIGATLVGGGTFQVTGLDVSFDGTNFVQWETFGSAVTVNAAQSFGGPLLAKSYIGVQAIKLRVATVTADGGNKLTLTAVLRALMKS